jgi:putative ABC transport system permease protein
MIQDYLRISLRSLGQRKLRSALTILAIVIGIAAVVGLVTMSQSLQKSIEKSFEVFGADKLMIIPASPTGHSGQPNMYTGLNTKDLEAVQRVADLKDVIPYLMKSDIMTYKGESKRIMYLLGLPAEDAKILGEDFGYEAETGSPFSTDGYHIFMGPLIAKDFFKKDISVKNKVQINGRDFVVTAILKPIGDTQDDSQVYMPLNTMRELYDEKEAISMMQATVKPGLNIEEAAKKVEFEMKKNRDEEEFEVYTADQLMAQMSSVLAIVQGILVSIAAISLLVGGIGIANVMYTSVLQRTREIGIMKAVGAQNKTILAIFVIESGIIGLGGGILGVILGILLAELVGAIAASSGWSILHVYIDPLTIMGGLLFSVAVGVISGVMPARQAASLKPIDALRFGK